MKNTSVFPVRLWFTVADHTRIATWKLFHRLDRLRREPDAGYSTEAVLTTAVLVLLALAAFAIFREPVLAKAREISDSLE